MLSLQIIFFLSIYETMKVTFNSVNIKCKVESLNLRLSSGQKTTFFHSLSTLLNSGNSPLKSTIDFRLVCVALPDSEFLAVWPARICTLMEADLLWLSDRKPERQEEPAEVELPLEFLRELLVHVVVSEPSGASWLNAPSYWISGSNLFWSSLLIEGVKFKGRDQGKDAAYTF